MGLSDAALRVRAATWVMESPRTAAVAYTQAPKWAPATARRVEEAGAAAGAALPRSAGFPPAELMRAQAPGARAPVAFAAMKAAPLRAEAAGSATRSPVPERRPRTIRRQLGGCRKMPMTTGPRSTRLVLLRHTPSIAHEHRPPAPWPGRRDIWWSTADS
jgi:hypothetical protein